MWCILRQLKSRKQSRIHIVTHKEGQSQIITVMSTARGIRLSDPFATVAETRNYT